MGLFERRPRMRPTILAICENKSQFDRRDFNMDGANGV
jgi:hypothetical protein